MSDVTLRPNFDLGGRSLGDSTGQPLAFWTAAAPGDIEDRACTVAELEKCVYDARCVGCNTTSPTSRWLVPPHQDKAICPACGYLTGWS